MLASSVFARRCHENKGLNFERLGFGGFVCKVEILRKQERCSGVRDL